MPQISIGETDVMEKLWDANMKMDMLHVCGGVCSCVHVFKTKRTVVATYTMSQSYTWKHGDIATSPPPLESDRK